MFAGINRVFAYYYGNKKPSVSGGFTTYEYDHGSNELDVDTYDHIYLHAADWAAMACVTMNNSIDLSKYSTISIEYECTIGDQYVQSYIALSDTPIISVPAYDQFNEAPTDKLAAIAIPHSVHRTKMGLDISALTNPAAYLYLTISGGNGGVSGTLKIYSIELVK